MQEDLNALVAWSDSWQMTLNEDQCKVMHIRSKNCEYSYHMRGRQLDSSQVERDLGVHVDYLLKVSAPCCSSYYQGEPNVGDYTSIIRCD